MSDRPKIPSAPPPPPTIDQPRAYVVEAVDGMLPFGRYRVYLSLGWLRYGGGDGWGWLRWTARSALKKGARELERYEKREARLAARQAAVDEAVGYQPPRRRSPPPPPPPLGGYRRVDKW